MIEDNDHCNEAIKPNDDFIVTFKDNIVIYVLLQISLTLLTDGINLLEVITEEVQSYANAPLRLKGQNQKLSVNTLTDLKKVFDCEN